MKKINKFLLSASGITAAFVPLIAAACSNTSNSSKEGATTGGTTTPSTPDQGDQNNPGQGGETNSGQGGADVARNTKDPNLGNTSLAERIRGSLTGANPNNQGQFRLDERTKISLGHSFSETGAQARGLTKIIEAYNAYVDANKANNPDLMQVEIKNIGSSYDQAATKIQQDLQAGQSAAASIPNFVINYAPTASTLASKNMLLSFNSNDNETNVDAKDFSPQFMKSNFEIEGIANQSTYVLPVFKSTNVMSINSSVLNYLLQKFEEAGGKFATDDKTQAFVAQIKKLGQGDFEGVKAVWGDLVSNARDLVSKAEEKYKTFNQDYFNNYVDLFKFSGLLQSLFTNSNNNGKPVEAGVHVFGIDGPAAFFGTSLASLGDGKPENSFSRITQQNGVTQVSFTNLQSGEARKNAETIFNEARSALANGSLVLQPSGAFSSSDQKFHKFAFSTGSTAGYSFNYVSGEATQYNFEFPQGTLTSGTSIEYDLSSNTRGFRTISLTKTPATEGALAYVGSHNNPIFEASKQNLGRFDLKFKDSDSEAKFNAVKSGINENSIVWIVSSSALADGFINQLKESNLYAGTVVAQNGSDNIMLLFNPTQSLLNGKVAVSPTEVEASLRQFEAKLNTISSTGQLNESELVAQHTPFKWASDSSIGVAFEQGPSIIGVLGTDKQNNAVRYFVKWLLNTKDKVVASTRRNDNSKYTPIEAIEKEMSYIVPVAGFEKATQEDLNNVFGNNKYLHVAFDTFKEVTDPANNVILYNEPAGQQSNPFRSRVDTAFGKTLPDAVKNGTQLDFNKFISDIINA